VRLFHAADIAAVAREAVQVKPPGAVFEYNNVNPQLLLALLEAATGMAYEDYLARHLWSRIAEAPAALWMDRAGGTPHGYCCMIATARDWLRLGMVLLGEGDVLPDARRAALLAPSVANPAYGQLIWRGSPWQPVRTYRPAGPFGVRHSAPYLADDTFFFDGYGGQRVYIVPSRRLVIVRTGAEIADWDDAALANTVMAALAPERAQ
jgi:CubicO group peptidase (beta-lactamase class C family)